MITSSSVRHPSSGGTGGLTHKARSSYGADVPWMLRCLNDGDKLVSVVNLTYAAPIQYSLFWTVWLAATLPGGC